MALPSTIHKAELSIADMDRHYYDTHRLTVARHPSETDERMMLRLLAFALSAEERLEMTRGLSSDDAPDLWRQSLSGEQEEWILLGLPSEKAIRQACARAGHVQVLSYGGKAAEIWWDKIKGTSSRFDNLTVRHVSAAESAALAALSARSMKIQVNIQDSEVMVSVNEAICYLHPQVWKEGR